jgi:bifunctional pyridoxal-dependent enzyme with beta-cystathionase and maltose regulon repressor activities
MAKKEKLVDLKPEKVTDEQLTKIQDIVNGINRAQMEVGRYEAGKHTLLHTIQVLQGELKLVQDELEKQYGTVNINIEDGTIKYPENGEANKKD